MTYKEAMRYIDSLSQFGSILGLTRIQNLLEDLGNPQDGQAIIHVAGTNGKGSVCALLSSILEQAGLRVGRYSSPAVYEYRERIQINGVYIPEHRVCRYLERIKAACARLVKEGKEHPTVFEVETAMCFLYFKEEQCDFVVLEVGLGGRFDSTNVIKNPVLSVITSISLDHTELLGGTLKKIAYEKAGIIKENRPVVLYQQNEEVLKVIRNICDNKKAGLTIADFACLEIVNEDFSGQQFHYKKLRDLRIRLLGQYQAKNAAVAVEAALTLKAEGYPVDEAAIRRGLWAAKWPGRFERIYTRPTIIVDGAHNPDAAARLLESIRRYLGKSRIIFVFGVFSDKDYPQILNIVRPASDTLIAFTPSAPRGLPSRVLVRESRGLFRHVIDGENAQGALRLALRLARPEDVILCFGSLSTIGEITRLCARLPREPECKNEIG
ncbi:MAG: bifunctional folylpolyglutamate synthase/dihydrofolate synthase [Oscillospiraceae bacterium]|nr:bifunctional folylpolyglutamate synthase/dihydrofolate synthase [Oscillospiraceae bacterium]